MRATGLGTFCKTVASPPGLHLTCFYKLFLFMTRFFYKSYSMGSSHIKPGCRAQGFSPCCISKKMEVCKHQNQCGGLLSELSPPYSAYAGRACIVLLCFVLLLFPNTHSLKTSIITQVPLPSIQALGLTNTSRTCVNKISPWGLQISRWSVSSNP